MINGEIIRSFLNFLTFYAWENKAIFFSSFTGSSNRFATMEMNTYREERRYSVPQGPNIHHQHQLPPAASEDLHAWSIYR